MKIIDSPIQNIIKLNRNINVNLFWHKLISITRENEHTINLFFCDVVAGCFGIMALLWSDVVDCTVYYIFVFLSWA